MSLGHVAAKKAAVNILSAIPFAHFAIVVALAGTIINKSASLTMSTCVIHPGSSSKTSIYVFFFVRAEIEVGVTNLAALVVSMTSISYFSFTRSLMNCTVLNAAIEPVIPIINFFIY